MDRVKDFFDMMAEFASWFGQMWGRGIDSPDRLINRILEYRSTMRTILANYVHPYFIGVFELCIGIALMHKIFKFNKE